MARIVCEHDVEAATVNRVIGLARVSRVTFYDLFEDRDDCLHAVLEETVALAAQRAGASYASESTWVDRVRAGLHTLLEFFDEEPELARLCVVHVMAASRKTLALRADRRPLVDLLHPMMSMIVLPYLGTAASHREASRARPSHTRPTRGRRHPVRDPLQGLEIRLTYRTVRVVAAIAARPGLSNGEVGERAGIADPGQISKLLTRLARLGLMENRGEGQAKGGTNAWHLTRRGAELGRAIRHDSAGLDG